MDLNCVCPFICTFFKINIHWPSVSLGFASTDSTKRGWKTVFLIHGWESTGRGADCLHYSLPFYIRDLGTDRFWYPQDILQPISHRFWGRWLWDDCGCVKSYTWIFHCTVIGSPNPYDVPGSTTLLIPPIEKLIPSVNIPKDTPFC